jgi:hypothetical protein
MRHKRWIDVIYDLVHNYNNSYHRSIKMTPVEGSTKENESTVYKNLYGGSEMFKKSNKFKVGDKVRISKWKGTFEKGYLPNWTTELFKVSKVLNTSLVTYKVKDFNNEEIEGSFYEPELVRFNKQDEVYEVEKILKTRIRNGKKEYFVSWRSYGPEFNSWIPAENLKN